MSFQGGASALDLSILLKQTGERAVAGAAKEMRRIAIDLKGIVVKMAPVDQGNLEAAVEMVETGAGNVMRQFEVRMNQAAVAREIKQYKTGNIKRLEDYVWLIHENLAPYGQWQLGDLSRAKQSGNPYTVGGGFITRAVELVDATVPARLTAAIELAILGPGE